METDPHSGWQFYFPSTAIPTCKHESYLGKTLSSTLGAVTSY